MAFKIRRNDDGKALALVEIGIYGECDYTPSMPEFSVMLAQSGLQFVDIIVPPPVVLPDPDKDAIAAILAKDDASINAADVKTLVVKLLRRLNARGQI